MESLRRVSSHPVLRKEPMNNVIEDPVIESPSFSGNWHELASHVLEGHRLTVSEGLAILRSSDEEILDVLAAAYRVRHRWHGNRVHLNFLVNAKSGRCAEDCSYCSQSGRASSEYLPLWVLDTDELYAGARRRPSGRRERIASSLPAAARPRPSWTGSPRSSPGSSRPSACISARRWDCSPRSRLSG